MRIDLKQLLQTEALPGAEGNVSLRARTIGKVVELFAESPPTTMVETGCQSTLLLHAHGMSTSTWGACAQQYGAVLHSVDIDGEKIRQCRELTREYAASIRYTTGDSVSFLSSFRETIDFLYLDSFDFGCRCEERSRRHQLAEISAAWGKLHPGSLVLLDDANVQIWFEARLDGLDVQGKTPYAHRFLMERGAQCLADYPGYQRLYLVGLAGKSSSRAFHQVSQSRWKAG